MSEAGDPGRATKYVDILPCGCRIVDDCKLHGPDSIALAALQKERDEAVAMINSASRNPVGFGDFINRQIEQERDGARVGGLQGRQPRHRGGGAVTAPEPSARCARCGVPEWDIAITTDGRQLATHPTPKCSEFDATPRCSRCGHKATYHGESRQGHAISQHSIHWCDCPAYVPPTPKGEP